MRIRKNARLLIFETPPHTVCKLNQSPWDVVRAGPEDWVAPVHTRKTSNSTSSYPKLDDGGANNLSGNGGIGDPIRALESIASAKIEKTDRATKSHKQNSSYDNSKKMQCVTNPSCGKSDKSSRPRGRGPGRKASTSNSNEFYYYSGFGPLWGKKRGGPEKRNVENNDNEMKGDELAGVIEDGSGDGSDNGGKRGRKAVKARSLKSLM